MIVGDRRIRYHLFDPGKGGWAAFARSYRSHLRTDRGCRTWAEKEADHRAVEFFSRGFLLKIMQGHKSRQLDGRGPYHSATSFEEARQILETLRSDGIQNIVAEMVGWNIDGHDGRFPMRFPVNPQEGGEEAFRKLIEWGHAQGCIVSVHDNCYDAHEIADNFQPEDCVVLRNGKVWRNIPWAGGFTYKICPTRALEYFERDARSLKRLGIDGHLYLDAMAAFFPCHSKEHPADRRTFLAKNHELLGMMQKQFGTLSVEVPFGPYLDVIDGSYAEENCRHAKLHTDFGRHWIDAVVPFLPIATHNGLRYHRLSDEHHGMAGALRTLAWGAMPFVEVAARPTVGEHSMPTYQEVRPYVQAAHALCCIEHVDRVDVDLEEVVLIGEDIFVTRYADGVELLINASPSPEEIEGRLVLPESVLRQGPRPAALRQTSGSPNGQTPALA